MTDERSGEARPLISPADMQVIERVLNLRTGYVLDFSDRTFDEFIAHAVSVDATAPRFSVDGGSKAKRLRRILPSLPAAKQAHLLRELLRYRDSPAREGSVDPLNDSWRRSYEQIVDALTKLPATEPPAPEAVAASSWTGRRTVREQVASWNAAVAGGTCWSAAGRNECAPAPVRELGSG